MYKLLLPLFILSQLILADLHVQTTDTKTTMIELFSSEGCSACPPAERWVSGLINHPKLWSAFIPLVFHVDYWDYIGWEDPFATEQTTERQYHYAEALGQRNVYTPQMIVQGANHATGSDRDKILALIARTQKSKRVAVTINRAEDGVRVTVAGADTTEEAAVWLAVFDNRHDTDIKRGENGGRMLSYYNVVRGMKRIGTWKGRPLEIPTGNADLSTEDRDGCAVILQSVSTGRILGAAKLVLTGS